MTTTRTTKTIEGPNGLRLVLDKGQVFKDDPGQGTPAMVYRSFRYGSKTYEINSTFWCAQGTGTLDEAGLPRSMPDKTFEKAVTLSDKEMEWLNAQEDELQAFLYPES